MYQDSTQSCVLFGNPERWHFKECSWFWLDIAINFPKIWVLEITYLRSFDFTVFFPCSKPFFFSYRFFVWIFFFCTGYVKENNASWFWLQQLPWISLSEKLFVCLLSTISPGHRQVNSSSHQVRTKNDNS